jgi:hypothetical protein
MTGDINRTGDANPFRENGPLQEFEMSEFLVYIYICTVFDFYIWISALLKYLFRVLLFCIHF